jgi:DNA-binding transcriptional LysR family regulator
MGHAFVVPALEAFHHAYPRIILDLTFGDRGTAFRVDGFDIVIRTGDAPISGWKMIGLGATRMICLASPDYIERYGAPTTPDELDAHHCIAYASVDRPGGNPWTLYQDGRKLRLRPKAAFTFNDGAAILAAARQGLGIAQTLEMLAREDIQAGRLVPLLPDIAWPRLSVVLMGARDRLALPHVEATLRFLVERIAWNLDPET